MADATETVLAHYRAGRTGAARDACAALLRQHAEAPRLWTLAGAIEMQAQDFVAAEAAFARAAGQAPGDANIHNNHGVALLNLARFEAAAAAFRRAVELDDGQAPAWANLGQALRQAGRQREAVEALERASRIDPGRVETWNQLGSLLRDAGALDAATSAYRRALALAPERAELHYNLGRVHAHQDRTEAAIAAYRQAIALDPALAPAHCNLAVVLRELGRFRAARACYDRVLALDPDQPDAQEGLGFMALQAGDLGAGFARLENRLHKTGPPARPPRPGLAWNRERSLEGAKALVYEEQGLGDVLHFCRYLPLLAARGADVTFQVNPRMHRLLSTLPGPLRLVAAPPPAASLDCEAPLVSLPHLLGTCAGNVPADVPYLWAPPDRVAHWAGRLPENGLRIGICWQGSTSRVDAGRSFPLARFAPLAALPEVRLISLHKGAGEDQLGAVDFEVTVPGPDFDGGEDAFCDTAAVMMHCDLVITSDTAVAHLAGALGRPVWLALKAVPDWRWMLERRDSPWYPTMTLYRQKTRGDWAGVFADIARDLEAFATRGKGQA